jgi:hypothetical protein
MAPHPPFIFERDGRPRRPAMMFRLADGPGFGGTQQEYVAQYSAQVEYMLRRTLGLIDSLLERPGPAPVIIVHGDHGPEAVVPPHGLDNEATRNRMAILSAYYLPDGPSDRLYPTITPVNGARLVARYFGAELPLLDDRSFFAYWPKPYQFFEIP